MRKIPIPLIVVAAILAVVGGVAVSTGRSYMPDANTSTTQSVNGTYNRTNSGGTQNASITVTSPSHTSTLHISGQAIWGTGPNHGEIEADIPFKNGYAQYIAPKGPSGKSCTVDFHFVPDALDVSITNLPACGEDPLIWGANVTFDGHYVLAGTKAK